MASKEGTKGKDRGKSGVANAAAHSFRLNGEAEDWAARRAGVYRAPRRSIGTQVVQGVIGGMLAMTLGYEFSAGPNFDRRLEESMKRAPVAGAVFDRLYRRLIRRKAVGAEGEPQTA